MTPQEALGILANLVEQANANAATHRALAEALAVIKSALGAPGGKPLHAAG